MVNIFNIIQPHRYVVFLTLTTFTMNSLSASLIHAQETVEKKIHVPFDLRIAQLLKKQVKYFKEKNVMKLIDNTLQVKFECEKKIKHKICLKEEILYLEQLYNVNIGMLNNMEFMKVFNFIDARDRITVRKEFCIDDVMNNLKAGWEENALPHTVDVPIRFTVGVTVALCGLFLMRVPDDKCKTWGKNLCIAGVTMAGDGMMEKAQRDQDEERAKRENKKCLN